MIEQLNDAITVLTPQKMGLFLDRRPGKKSLYMLADLNLTNVTQNQRLFALLRADEGFHGFAILAGLPVIKASTVVGFGKFPIISDRPAIILDGFVQAMQVTRGSGVCSVQQTAHIQYRALRSNSTW